MANNLTSARLREIVRYEAETGDFILLIRRSGRSQPVGSKIGTANSAGYDRIMIDGRSYLSHRLAWLYATGKWPQEELDHINGNPRDNRLANLREASRSKNNANTRRPRHNTSGIKGVSARGARWVATINAAGKQMYLGSFGTREQAADAYAIAANRYHGEFARLA